jgi:hypothetical protein
LRDAAAGEAILAAFEADLASGHFDVPTCNLASVLIEAKRLSASHTVIRSKKIAPRLHLIPVFYS